VNLSRIFIDQPTCLERPRCARIIAHRRLESAAIGVEITDAQRMKRQFTRYRARGHHGGTAGTLCVVVGWCRCIRATRLITVGTIKAQFRGHNGRQSGRTKSPWLLSGRAGTVPPSLPNNRQNSPAPASPTSANLAFFLRREKPPAETVTLCSRC